MSSVPVVRGLVLAGGRSVRMGIDKGTINWHGKEQRYFAADLLQAYCPTVYISCRPEQAQEIDTAYKALPDIYTGLGPYGGILTAMAKEPVSAWLVVACDLPLLNHATLSALLRQRDPSVMATTFRSPHDGLPEPLITIWEPASYPILLDFKDKGIRCPRKVLIKSKINLLEPPEPTALMNTNTPEEAALANTILKSK